MINYLMKAQAMSAESSWKGEVPAGAELRRPGGGWCAGLGRSRHGLDGEDGIGVPGRRNGRGEGREAEKHLSLRDGSLWVGSLGGACWGQTVTRTRCRRLPVAAADRSTEASLRASQACP